MESSHSHFKDGEPSGVRFTGAVYTPIEVANALTKMAVSKLHSTSPSIIEPSVGDGLFISALQGSLDNVKKLTAIDIDGKVIAELSAHFEGQFSEDSSFIEQDFIEYFNNGEQGYADLVIGNPPFIRRHNYSDKFKKSLIQLSANANYEIKYLKNAWAAFLVASERLLNDTGVMAFIVPYEFMTVIYGQKIQGKISCDFARLDIFVPDEKAFKGIDQDAVAIVAQKKSIDPKGTYVHRVSCLSDLQPITTHCINSSDEQDYAIELKAFLLTSDVTHLLHKLRTKCFKVGNYCDSAPGLVTAANDFFIRSKEDVQKLGLAPWAHSVLKKASFLPKGPVFSKNNQTMLEENGEPTEFLNFAVTETPQLTTEVSEYLKYGEELKLNERYKCRNRSPWYRVPIVKPAEALFFKRSHSHPRLCINEAGVYVTDTAYGIRCKKGATVRGLCFSFYNSLTLLFSEIDGRFYGGGVLELTPKEFRGLPLVYMEPSEEDFQNFYAAHFIGQDTIIDLADFGDAWLKIKLKLTDDEISGLRDAWLTLRNHRLRHSSKNNRKKTHIA